MRSEETRTGKTGKEAGARELIVGLQEKVRMVIEDLSSEVGEGVSVDTTWLRLPTEGTKKERGQGADTQQPEGEEWMAQQHRVWMSAHTLTQPDRMWRREEHLGMDWAADRVDHADDPGANPGGVADAAAISYLAVTTELGIAMNLASFGMV
jgi:hypothetical protein